MRPVPAYRLYCLLFVVAVAGLAVALPRPDVLAQDKSKTSKKAAKPRAKPHGNIRPLDVKAEQLQSAFVKESEELAAQYFESGHIDKARALLQSLVQMNPELTEIQKKIERLDESLLSANDNAIEVNPANAWESAGVMVFEGRAVRFQVEGSYRFDVSGNLTAAGLPAADPVKDIIPAIRTGALIGVVVVDGKPGDPFEIGEGRDFTPTATGVLALRVNAPAGNKNSGKLKVTISGWVRSGLKP